MLYNVEEALWKYKYLIHFQDIVPSSKFEKKIVYN